MTRSENHAGTTHTGRAKMLGIWVAMGVCLAESPPTTTDDSSPPSEDAPQARLPPGPSLSGLVDLHLHMFAEKNLAGEFFFGSATSTLDQLAQCGKHKACDDTGPACQSHYHANSRTARFQHHAQLGFANRFVGGPIYNMAQDVDETDDGGQHFLAGLSADETTPHWLGYPTSDNVGHQQVWQGWLRAAHDTIPLAGFVVREHDEPGSESADIDLDDEMDRFYAEYTTNMQAARMHGEVGLNAAVVSLVGGWSGCVVGASRGKRLDLFIERHEDFYEPDHDTGDNVMFHPSSQERATQTAALRDRDKLAAVCSDRTTILSQYVALHRWADDNSSWVELVDTPDELERAVFDGKLALLINVESSDWLNGYWRNREQARQNVCPNAGGECEPGPVAQEALRLEWDAFHDDAARVLSRDKASLAWITSAHVTHQLGNALAGPAMVRVKLNQAQAARLRGGGRVLRHPEDAFVDDETLWSYAQAFDERIAERARSSKFWFAVESASTPESRARVFSPTDVVTSPEDGRLALYRKAFPQEPAPPGYVSSTLGLSLHGRALVRMLDEAWRNNKDGSWRPMLELAHLSDEALADLEKLRVDERLLIPTFHSHAIPSGMGRLPREQNADPHQLEALDPFLVGVRTADDSLLLLDRGPDAPAGLEYCDSDACRAYADLVDKAQCDETLLNYALASEIIGSRGLATALGSDLNGFINHSGPLGTLQTFGADDRAACGLHVRGLGSEVDRRGMAHVGLAPQAVLASGRILSGPGSADQNRVLDRQMDSVQALLQGWRGDTSASSTQADDAHAQAPATFAGMDGMLTRAQQIEVTVETRFLSGSGDEGERFARTRLPLLRALEGAVPYRNHQLDGKTDHMYPQLPTTLGFLYGAQQFGGYPSPRARKRLSKACTMQTKGTSSTHPLCEQFALEAKDLRARFKQGNLEHRYYAGESRFENDLKTGLRHETFAGTDDLASALKHPTAKSVADSPMHMSSQLDMVLQAARTVIDDNPWCATAPDFMYAWTPGIEGFELEGRFGLYNWSRYADRRRSAPRPWRAMQDALRSTTVAQATGTPGNDGDLCVCRLLENLEEYGAFQLTDFDRERLRGCGPSQQEPVVAHPPDPR